MLDGLQIEAQNCYLCSRRDTQRRIDAGLSLTACALREAVGRTAGCGRTRVHSAQTCMLARTELARSSLTRTPHDRDSCHEYASSRPSHCIEATRTHSCTTPSLFSSLSRRLCSTERVSGQAVRMSQLDVPPGLQATVTWQDVVVVRSLLRKGGSACRLSPASPSAVADTGESVPSGRTCRKNSHSTPREAPPEASGTCATRAACNLGPNTRPSRSRRT